jgi:hypothetical protein
MLPLCGIFCRKFLIKSCLQAYLFYYMIADFDTTSVLPIIFVAELRIMRNYKCEEILLFYSRNICAFSVRTLFSSSETKILGSFLRYA